MTCTQLTNWLNSYGQAWETRDPDRAAALFTDDATYQETPFGRPVRARAGIRQYWEAATRNQRDVKFSFEIIFSKDERAVIRWWSEFTRTPSGVRVKLDGIFVLEFDKSGLCRNLMEWWHKAEQPPAT